jgi:nucleotide-binding universal stress UspA family protein
MMPPPRGRRFRAVVCAVDFSRQSAKAVRYAAAVAAAGGGRVHVLHVMDPLLFAAAATADDPAALERRALRDLARFVRSSLRAPGAADAHLAVSIGKPAASLVSYARRCHASVIVMGTAGRRGAGKFFFGSTTEAVLRRFRGAVLAIPPRCPAPGPGWPGSSMVGAIDGPSHRRARVHAAARMAEIFGGWLSVPRTAEDASAATRARLIILPLARAARLRLFRQGSAAYRFISRAVAPVLVIHAGTADRTGTPGGRKAA